MEKSQQANKNKVTASKRLALCNADFLQNKIMEKNISINPEKNDMPVINIWLRFLISFEKTN